MRRLALALLVSLAALACTSAGTGGKGALTIEEIASELHRRDVDLGRVVLPFGLTAEMRDWARQLAPRSLPPRQRLARLRDELLAEGALELTYDWRFTGTAAEVFATRRANCLAFTNLFVGMAREVGLDAYFLGVDVDEIYRRQGDLVIVSDHVAVGFGPPGDRVVFDFSDNPPGTYRRIEPLSDLHAIAMFHSNRGAEALQEGHVAVAVEWMEVAVAVAPELADSWINLGVARRRAGDLDGAEEAYRRALELDPGVPEAYGNLASLLRLDDRAAEADVLERLAPRSADRNPYPYLELGDLSFANARFAEAERYYRRAVDRRESAAEPFAEGYAALGEAALALGETGRARKLLRRARRLDPQNPRTLRLAARLGGGTT